jgi:hypothetical protein
VLPGIDSTSAFMRPPCNRDEIRASATGRRRAPHGRKASKNRGLR